MIQTASRILIVPLGALWACALAAGADGPQASSRPAPATVRVAICQMASADGKIEQNLAAVAGQAGRAAEDGAALCVFPELVDVGFGPIVKAPGSDAPLAFPIPGRTTDRLGAIAREHGVWISAAVLEKVEGGAYDTNVLIDAAGRVVHKQRKAFCYPGFAGTTAFQGNGQDFTTVDSPWGPLGLMNCADTANAGRRLLLAAQKPALVLVNFANPQANLLPRCNELARECGCPVVGTNMLFPTDRNPGGRSLFVAADGDTLWQAGQDAVVKTWSLELPHRAGGGLPVDAGEVQTLRWPQRRIRLAGRTARDWPGLKVEWSKVDGRGEVLFDDAAALQPSAAFSEPGVYVLRLAVTAAPPVEPSDDFVCVNVLPAEGDPSLVGCWPFDKSADDVSGRRNHATLQGKADFSTDAAPIGRPNAGSLRVAGGYALVPHAESLNAPALATVMAWVKVRTPPPMWPDPKKRFAGLLGKGGWWKENYALGMGDYFYLFARGFDGVMCPALDDTVRTSGRWHHVAGVLDAFKGQCRLYIDGVLNHTALAVARGQVNSDPLCIGGFAPGREGLDGWLDDVRVYTRPLSDAEVAAFVSGAHANRPPALSAAAAGTLEAAVGRKLILAGSVQDDAACPSARAAAWTAWRKLLGPGPVQFGNRFAPSTDARFAEPGEYLLELRASDGGHVVWDTVRVRVSGR